jgi:hypothetical protein
MNTVVYRVRGKGIDFATVGQLQKHQGVYVVVASASWDDALQLQLNAKNESPITILVEVNGEAVAVMPIHKVRAKERKGAHVELWAIVDMADPFMEALRT